MAKKTFIGRAFISITGDKKGLDAVLSKIRGQMESLGKDLQKIGYRFMAAGAAIQAPLTLAVRQFAKFGDEMAKGARRAGISAKAYSEFAHVAQLGGTSIERFEKALQAMARGMFDAKRGTGEMKDALKVLGVNWQDLEALAPEERFERLADAVSKVKDPSIKAAVAMKIWGKAGAELIPMLNLGAEGIRYYRAEAERLGVSMGPKAASLAERLTDMMTRLKAAFLGVALTVGEILAPSFERFLVYATNLVANVREFIQNNPGLVRGLQQIAVALTAIGAGLVGLGTLSRLLAPLVSPGGVLLALGAVLLYISGALDPLIDKWGKAVLGFEVGGRSVREWLGIIAETFGELWETIKASFGDLGRMLAPLGDTALAVLDSIWQQVKAGFMDFRLWLVDQIRSLLDVILEALLRVAENRKLSLAARQTAAGAAAALTEVQTSLTGARTRWAGERVEQHGTAGAARENAAGWARDLPGALAGPGAALRDRWADFAAGTGKRWGSALEPLLGMVFGGEGAAGGVKSLGDIFKGLGREFREFRAPELDFAGGPAVAAAHATLGTFSGRGAAAIAADPGLQIQREQLEHLASIDDKVGRPGGVFDSEDF